jgi:hypothetical protein
MENTKPHHRFDIQESRDGLGIGAFGDYPARDGRVPNTPFGIPTKPYQPKLLLIKFKAPPS